MSPGNGILDRNSGTGVITGVSGNRLIRSGSTNRLLQQLLHNRFSPVDPVIQAGHQIPVPELIITASQSLSRQQVVD